MRLLLVLPLVVVAALCPVEQAQAARSVVVTAPARVSAGAAVTFTGRVLPRRRTTIVLQRRVGSHWVRTRTGNSTKRGRFAIAATAVAGRSRYRIVATGRPSRPITVIGVPGQPPPKEPLPPTPVPPTPPEPTVPAGMPRSIADLTAETMGGGFDPSASNDGRWVAFVSLEQFVPEDTNHVTDVYVRDTTTGSTTLVSRNPGGLAAIPHATGGAGPDISPDGGWVAFESEATGLAPAPAGSTAGSHVFLWHRRTGTIQQVTALTAREPEVSDGGGAVVFGTSEPYDAGDTNWSGDVIRWERATGATALVSVRPDGQVGNGWSEGGSMSDDGLRIAFHSLSSDLVAGDSNGSADIFLWTSGQVVRRISGGPQGEPASGHSLQPAISGDGTAIAYASMADNLAPELPSGDQALVYRWTQATGSRVATTGLGGTVPSAPSLQPSISTDGRRVSFLSSATNLAPGASGGYNAAYVWDAATGDVQLASRVPGGAAANDTTLDDRLVGDGTRLLLSSTADNLVPDDAVAGVQHLFLVTLGLPAA